MKKIDRQCNKSKKQQFKRLKCICYSLLFWVVLCSIVFVDSSLAENPEGGSIANLLETSEVTPILTTLLFVAWLVERFFEIVIKAFRLDKEDNEFIKPKLPQITAIAGFAIGLIIYFGGIRTIESFYDAEGLEKYLRTLLDVIDAILTAGIIAGGSQGVHELANAYQGIMQKLKKLDNPQKPS